MSETVNTKAVEMRFDNRNFETNVKQSMSTLDKLKQSLKLKGASEGLKEVEKASKNLDFKDTGSALDKLGKKFSALETIATGVFLRIGMQAADAGMKFVKSFTVDQVAAGWGKYEEKTTAVQTIMANLKDDASKFVDEASKMRYVEGYLNKLMWFSDETSYSFTDMTGNVGKFIANGQGLDESVTAMQGIATWAAMSGQNAQTASRAMYNISQAMGVGSMKIKDWMSIEIANMATAQFKELAIAIGEEKGTIKKGAVTVESFLESLSGKGTKDWFNKDVMMEVFKTYGAAADRIQEYAMSHNVTSTEAIKEIKKQDEEFANSLGFKAFAAAQEAKTFSEVVSATADAVSTKWLRIFENIFGNYLEAKEMWTGLSEDLWDMFAGPLDQINAIMSKWKRGFLKNGPKTTIDIAYETGELDDIESKFSYITKEAAEQQVAIDADTYAIEKLEDGTERLIRTVKTASGEYKKEFKTIYNADQRVISGREMLISGFKNILDAFFHDTEAEDGHEILSVFGAIRKAFLETFFPNETDSSLAKTIWNLTKKFQAFTEKLKPSEETIGKIKNAFKGLFSIIKIGAKIVGAIIKPFRDLFERIFGNIPKNLLDAGSGLGVWLQELEKFLNKNKVFKNISDWISTGFNKIASAAEYLSQTLFGVSLSDFVSGVKDKVVKFFKDYDFKGHAEKIIGFFGGIIEQIRQVNTGNLPEKLTPLQVFYTKAKKIFDAIKTFFEGIGSDIGNAFSNIRDAAGNIDFSVLIDLPSKIGGKISTIWEGIKNAFENVKNFFEKAAPVFQTIGTKIENFFTDITKNHDALDIIKSILGGGLAVSGISALTSLSGMFKSIKNTFKGVAGILRAYQHDIDSTAILKIAAAIAILAGSFWLLAQVDPTRIEQAGTALGIIGGAVAGLLVVKDVISLIGKLKATPVSDGGPFSGIKSLLTSVVEESIFANDKTAKFVKICLGILLAAIAIGKVVHAISDVIDIMERINNPKSMEAITNGGIIVTQILLVFGAFALLSGLSPTATSALFAAIGIYILVKALANVIDIMADLGGDSKKLENVKKVYEEFKDVFDAIGKLVKIVLGIAIALAVIQGIMVVFASVSDGDTNGIAKTLKNFGNNFLKIAFSLVILAVAVGLMAAIAKNIDPGTMGLVLSVFAVFVGLISALELVATGFIVFGKGNGEEIAKALSEIGNVFLKIAASLIIVAAAFAILAIVHAKNPDSIGIASLIFGIFLAVGTILTAFAMNISKDAGRAKNIVGVLESISMLFVALGISLLIVTAAFAVFSTIKFDNASAAEIAIILGSFLVIVGAIGIIAGALIKDSKSITAIGMMAAFIVTVAASLIIVAQAFSMFAGIKFSDDAPLWVIATTFGVFLLIVAGIAVAATYFIKDAKAYSAVGVMAGFIVTVAASLIIVAQAFSQMSSIDFGDPGKFWSIAGVFVVFLLVVGGLAALGALLISDGMAIAGVAMIAGLMITAAISLGILALAFGEMASKTSPEQLNSAINVMIAFGILVALLAVIGTGLAATGVGIVGMAMVAVIILAIGAACLMAGIGISVMVAAVGNLINAFSELMTAIAEKGPQFAANLQIVVDAVLDTIINSAPKAKDAAIVVITAIAQAFLAATPIIGMAIIALIVQLLQLGRQSLSTIIPIIVMSIVDAINILADTLRASSPLLCKAVRNLFEAVIELTLESIASLLELIPGIGEGLANGVIGWIPGIRDAFKTIDEETDSALDHVGEKFNYETGQWEVEVPSGEESAEETGKKDGETYAASFSESAESGIDMSSIMTSVGVSMPTGESGIDMSSLTSGLTGGSGIDMSSLTSGLTGDLEGMDFGGIMNGKMGDLTQSISDSTPAVSDASKETAKSIEEPITSLDSYKWGEDIGTLLSDGLLSKMGTIKDTSNLTAQTIKDILGFSEPKEGPLSDFHTYAPDMIKLWCSGIKDNLHFVDNSSNSMAGRIKEGLSSALDYVSGLIDGGMTDELTIRPIMDLSEIQNGVQLLDSMLGNNNYPLYGTSRIASYTARNIEDSKNVSAPITPVEQTPQVGATYNNTFNISSNDPDAVADRVSRILQNQTEREKAVWARR